jgi:hypothetical protein
LRWERPIGPRHAYTRPRSVGGPSRTASPESKPTSPVTRASSCGSEGKTSDSKGTGGGKGQSRAGGGPPLASTRRVGASSASSGRSPPQEFRQSGSAETVMSIKSNGKSGSGRRDLRDPLERAAIHERFAENLGELADRRNAVQREGTRGDGAGGNWEATKSGALPYEHLPRLLPSQYADSRRVVAVAAGLPGRPRSP